MSKTVEGDGAKLAPAEFTFEYTCTDKVTGQTGSPKQVVVKAGQTTHVGDVPTGSCTLTEKDASAKGTSLSTALAVGALRRREARRSFDVLGGDNAGREHLGRQHLHPGPRPPSPVSKKVEGDGG